MVLFALAATARGRCDFVAVDTIIVDGRIDDWGGIGKRTLSSAAGSGLATRCVYDSTRLYLIAEITDNRIIRHRRASPKEDSVTLVIGNRQLSITVAPGTRGFPPRIGGHRKWMEVADSRTPNGFTIEVSVPLRKIPGWNKSIASVKVRVSFRDADGGRPVIRTGQVRFDFSEADALLKSFLRAVGQRRSAIRLDVLRDVDLGRGRDRVVFVGTVIGVLTDQFIYLTLPVADSSDVIAVKVVNFSGDGRAQILAHYKQHGNGTRELVSVWNVDANNRFVRVLTVEVGKSQGTNRIINQWSLVRAGKLRSGVRTARRGYDLVVEAIEAVGFSSANYRETRATDADPILLPWTSDDTRVYFFNGDELEGSQPMDATIHAKRKRARARAHRR